LTRRRRDAEIIGEEKRGFPVLTRRRRDAEIIGEEKKKKKRT
jgi:hypothetical protein